jgi:D-aspartate ligase
LNHVDDHPGAVLLGGDFVSVGAARNLAAHGIKVCIIGDTDCVAQFSRSVSQFIKFPKDLKHDDLPDYLMKVAEKHSIRGWVLFALYDEHVRILSQHDPRLAEYYILTTPPWETYKLFYDKRLTYALAREADVAIPDTHVSGMADQLADLNLDFPVVLKPAIASRFIWITKKKAHRADNLQELQCHYEKMLGIIDPSEVIVQALLPEPSRNLFSFAGYFREGEPIATLSAKRTRQFPIEFGWTSSFVEVVENPELRALACQLLRSTKYTGFVEVEFMWNEKHGRFELLEVNARLWAWHGLAIAAGLDLPYTAFAYAIGQTPTPGVVRQGMKWIKFVSDLRAATQEIRSGKLTIQQYLSSLCGPKTFSIFSLSDPVPFIVLIFIKVRDQLKNMACL